MICATCSVPQIHGAADCCARPGFLRPWTVRATGWQGSLDCLELPGLGGLHSSIVPMYFHETLFLRVAKPEAGQLHMLTPDQKKTSSHSQIGNKTFSKAWIGMINFCNGSKRLNFSRDIDSGRQVAHSCRHVCALFMTTGSRYNRLFKGWYA